ncbi:MAG: NAD(P)H-dependent oxidoreductase subunit E [Deltaproteobacteria bacterium]|nr:NAD(P)H-dependent oxidoreductase subunit E [Deltaproteobacteria bacterium]
MASDTSTNVTTPTADAPNLLDAFPDKRQALEEYLDSLPLARAAGRKKGFLIQSLHRAQAIFGYLPEEVQVLVAKKLELHLSEVYGVISFYSFFTDKPVGKHKINVCTGTACFVRGADIILQEFARQLKISEGETSEDGMFSLGGLRCVGACSLAPVVMVNEDVEGNVEPPMVKKIIRRCMQEGE